MQISALNGPQVARRGAELVSMLDVASSKIDRYGWERMDKSVKFEIKKDWADVLCVYTLAEVKAGIDAVFEESKGNLRTINEHQVKAKIEAARARHVAALPKQEPPKQSDRVSKERAAEIMKEVGFKAKTFDT